MSDRWDELREAAQRATPGPWEVHEVDRCGHGGAGVGPCCDSFDLFVGGPEDVVVFDLGDSNTTVEQQRANAAFSAAANPQTVLDLLAERDALADEAKRNAEHAARRRDQRDQALYDAACREASLAEQLAEAEAERDQLAEALRARNAWRPSKGCGDHSCWLVKPTGQGTNGGCRCFGAKSTRDKLRNAAGEVERARAELEQLLAGVETVRRYLMCDGEEWPSSADLSAEDYGDALTDRALALLCEQVGHRPTRDHCGKPEHDFCLYCKEPTPGEASR